MFKKFSMVVAIVFMFAFTLSPALAGDTTVVVNDNEGTAINLVGASANSGDNFADGSYGGDGDDGGDMDNDGDDIRRSSTGRGGAGGSSAAGGLVTTGNANAEAGALNVVNTNYTEIDECACEEEEPEPCCTDEAQVDGPPMMYFGDDTIVYNRNRHLGVNAVRADANTGGNDALGSYAGKGGDAGDMDNDGEGGDIVGSSTGAGGAGGDSGVGGDVLSGHANSRAMGVNVLGTNITRIRR